MYLSHLATAGRARTTTWAPRIKRCTLRSKSAARSQGETKWIAARVVKTKDSISKLPPGRRRRPLRSRPSSRRFARLRPASLPPLPRRPRQAIEWSRVRRPSPNRPTRCAPASPIISASWRRSPRKRRTKPWRFVSRSSITKPNSGGNLTSSKPNCSKNCLSIRSRALRNALRSSGNSAPCSARSCDSRSPTPGPRSRLGRFRRYAESVAALDCG